MIIFQVLPDLRRHHIRSSYLGLSQVESLTHEFGYSEVSHFELVGVVDENVIRLDVSVDYFLLVDVLESKGQLDKPDDDCLLSHGVRLGLPEL